ncbi:MAG: beta-galactosidase, partial [Bacteroidota bacterium]
STHSLEAFVEATQVAQGVIFQYALEHFRHRKPKTSAVVICHYITFAPDMKWGIVDYYREKKLSFDYVRKAYQPLLVSLKHDARRFLSGSVFRPEIWVVNDYYKPYENCSVELTWLDNEKNETASDTYTLDTILPDSSKSFVELSHKVRGEKGKRFYVELKLKDAQGNILSENDYFFLIADPLADRQRIREIGQEAMETKQKYGWANYYRYFEGLGGESGVKDADEQMPFVTKFQG